MLPPDKYYFPIQFIFADYYQAYILLYTKEGVGSIMLKNYTFL
jgi:hypothetical protein